MNSKHIDKIKILEEERDDLIERLFFLQEMLGEKILENSNKDNEFKRLKECHDKKLKSLKKIIESNKDIINRDSELIKKILIRQFPVLGGKDEKEYDTNLLLVSGSKLFDAVWYVRNYPEVLNENANPAEHYLLHGYIKKMNPSEEFDGNWYADKYPDVKHEKVNPLLHYELYGKSEGREIKSL